VPFDKRCQLASLYGVTAAPQMVAISVHNKMTREKNIAKLIEFVQQVKAANPKPAVPQKSAA